ncbi:MAG: CoA transferase [Minwuia sp.]|nr:CoA transferase [Minwuia sp.]
MTTQPEPDYATPFKGLKVLDLSQGVAAPHCGMLLALYGADVVKVEPFAGDWIRPIGVQKGEHSAHSVYYSRGKRSIALDLKNPDGLAIVQKLAAEADVMLESFRPGVAERLGVGYAAMRERNPALLYVSVSGFGQTGPYRERPCTDTVAQAFSGLMSLNTAPDGTPVKVGAVIVDTLTGLFAYQAVATAIYARRDGGAGRHLDVSLMGGAAALLAPKVLEAAMTGTTPAAFNPPAGNYQTRDGWIAVTLVRDTDFPVICETIGLPEIGSDPRLKTFAERGKHLDVIREAFLPRFMERTSAEWLELLKAKNILCDPVMDLPAWLDHPHVQATDTAPVAAQPGFGDSPLVRVPGALQSPADIGDAPEIGEQGAEILAGLGYGADEIKALASGGAVRLR